MVLQTTGRHFEDRKNRILGEDDRKKSLLGGLLLLLLLLLGLTLVLLWRGSLLDGGWGGFLQKDKVMVAIVCTY